MFKLFDAKDLAAYTVAKEPDATRVALALVRLSVPFFCFKAASGWEFTVCDSDRKTLASLLPCPSKHGAGPKHRITPLF